MSGFLGELHVKLIKDDRDGEWELLAPLSFRSDLVGRTITAPAGHRTDFCSVPRVPLAYEMLGNRARMSGTIHDWLYTSHELTREQADEVLREMLVLNGIGKCEAEEFHLAVRTFGGTHWEPKPAANQPAEAVA
jgi:hypothetical protein